MNLSVRPRHRLILLAVIAGMFVASCGGGSDRSRNVETVAATACTKKGATKSIAKVDYVCGVATAGQVWFAVVGKLTTKGAKSCKPLGKYDAGKSRVCGAIKKSNVWVKVAPLPVVASNISETTTVPTSAESATPPTTTTGTQPEKQIKGSDEVAQALAPNPPAKTAEDFVAEFVPRPVQAQAATLVPTSIKIDKSTATVANGGKVSIAVSILDQNDAPLKVAGNTVVATSSRIDVELTNAVAVADESGVATFGDLQIDGASGDLDVTFTADFGATANLAVALTAGDAVRLGVANEVPVAVVNKPLQVAPKVGVYDKDGNLRKQSGISITAKFNGKVLATKSTDGDGYAEFPGLAINTKLTTARDDSAVITYSASPDSANVTSVSQTIKLIGAEAAKIDFVTQPSTSARVDMLLDRQPVLRLFDANGNPTGREGVKVTIELVCPAEAFCRLFGTNSVTTDADGIARFTNLSLVGEVGGFQLLAYADINADVVLSDPIKLSAGEAVRAYFDRIPLVFQHGIATHAAIALLMTDAVGNLADGFNGPVTVSVDRSAVNVVIPGNARFVNGRANLASITVAGVAGPFSISFGSGEIMSDAASRVLMAGTPAKIEVLSKPGTVQSGKKLDLPLAVRLRDSADNIVEVANRPIRLTLSEPNAATEDALTTTAGVATFTIDKLSVAGTTTVSYADSVGDAPTARDSIVVVAGDLAKAKLTDTTTVAARSDAVLPRTLGIQLVDAADNPIARSGITVTARIVLGVMGATLGGNTAVTDAKGQAVFSSLILKGKVGGYRIGFGASGIATSGQLSVSLGAGDPAAMVVTTQPSGAVNRVALTTQPVVALRDSAGNDAAVGGVVITATVDGASTTARTSSSGIATFAGVTAKGLVDVRRITFTSDGIASVNSDIFVMYAGALTSLVPTATTMSGVNGLVIPDVVGRDADGNRATSDRQVVVSTTATGGEAWLTGSKIGSLATGTASFGLTRLWSTETSAKLTYSLDGTAISAQTSVNFTTSILPGDPGPSGGVVIARMGGAAAAVTGYTSGGRFVEAAPAGWDGTLVDPQRVWSNRLWSSSDGNFLSIGFAAVNTQRYVNYLAGIVSTPTQKLTMPAIEYVASKFAADRDDWLLPTSAEVQAMVDVALEDNSRLQLNVTSTSGEYWSSSFDGRYGVWAVSPTRDLYAGDNYKSKLSSYSVRPIRYFG